MRRLFAVLVGAVLTVGLVLPASAQDDALDGFTLGARGGISVATASFDIEETIDKSNRTGFLGGVFANWSKAAIGFQVEGLYAQKGVELEGDEGGTVKVDYIQFPVLVKLGLPLGTLKPGVFAGIQYSALARCREELVGDTESADCRDDLKNSDWSVPLGADLKLGLGSISLWIDGRYDIGLSDINEMFEEITDLKNRAWAFTGGIGFSL